jgi:hypothetical protein
MRRPHLLISAAWTLHAIAWFVPVIKDGVVLPHGIPGLEAFWVAASPIFNGGADYDTWYDAFLAATSAITTVLFVAGSPWVMWRRLRVIGRSLAWVAAVAFVVNAHWYISFGSNRSDLRLGYFLWWLSFGLLAIGLFDLARLSQIDETAKARAANVV